MLIDSLEKNSKLTQQGAVDAHMSQYFDTRWVTGSADPVALETREFLEICFANLPSDKQCEICGRVECEVVENVDACLHELVCHELLRWLHLEPKFTPKLSDGSTPDMLARIGGQDFVVDVFLTANPCRTIASYAHIPSRQQTLRVPQPTKNHGDAILCVRSLTVDRGDRAKKIRDTIKDKHRKYARTGRPMLLVVFLKDGWMQLGNVECALYGACRGEDWLQDCFPPAPSRPLSDRLARITKRICLSTAQCCPTITAGPVAQGSRRFSHVTGPTT
jgi:hypothetical protein